MSLNIKAKNTSYTLSENNESGKFVLLQSNWAVDKGDVTLTLTDSDLDTYDILLVNLGFIDSGYKGKISGFCNFIPMSMFKSLQGGPSEITTNSIPFLCCEYYSWDFKNRYGVKLYKNTNNKINIRSTYSSIQYYIYGVKF